MKHVIAFTGEMGCGKDTAIKMLEEMAGAGTFGRVSSSNFLKDQLRAWDVLLNRENLQRLPVLMNEGFGSETFNNAMGLQIKAQSQAIVIFDSVRFPHGLTYLQKNFKTSLIYINASSETRYQRIIVRNEKHGEHETTFEQFLAQHTGPTEADIPSLKKHATLIVDNNGDLESLHTQITKFFHALK